MREPNIHTAFQRRRGALMTALPADLQGCLQQLRAELDSLPERQRVERAAAGVGLSRIVARQSEDAVEAVRGALASLATIRPPASEPHEDAQRSPLLALLTRLLWREEPRAASERHPARLVVDRERLLESVSNALEAAARAIDDSDRAPADPWTTDQSLLKLLQDLVVLRRRGDANAVLRRLEDLEAELRLRHGIKAVRFDGDNEEWFEFWPSPNPDDPDPVTRRPALVGPDGLLQPGEVLGPQAGTGLLLRAQERRINDA